MNTPRGFSTVELLLALMIMSTALTAIVLVTLGVPESLADGREAEVGASEASALMSKALILGRNSFSGVTSIASTTSEGYTLSLQVTPSPDGLSEQLLSTAEWTNVRGAIEYFEESGAITNFRNASQNACSSVLAGNWLHPSVSTFPIAQPISAVSTGTSTLILSVTKSVNKTDPTLLLFDISSSTNPAFLGSLDNATSTRSGIGAVAVNESSAASASSTRIIYAANSYGANFSTCTAGPLCAQLQIIDASNPANPLVISNFQLSTTTPPFATGSGMQSAGKSIFYANGFVYFGLQKTGSTGSANGEEFNIINVQNPYLPVWVGGFSVGRTVNQISVKNGYAYLATDDPTRELTILDVHDPANITLAGTYDAPGNSTFGFGEAVALASSTIALGRSYIYGVPELVFLNNTPTSTLAVLQSVNINGATGTASIESILIRGSIAFVLTNTALQLWDISDLTRPIPYAPTISLPSSSVVSGTSALACRNNTLYIASSGTNNAGYLTVITGS
jgi:hypothetical protein